MEGRERSRSDTRHKEPYRYYFVRRFGAIPSRHYMMAFVFCILGSENYEYFSDRRITSQKHKIKILKVRLKNTHSTIKTNTPNTHRKVKNTLYSIQRNDINLDLELSK